MKGPENPTELAGLDADARVLDRHEYGVGLMSLRADRERPLAVVDPGHGFHAVDDKIDDHLLKLDAITAHRRQSRREIKPHGDLMPQRVVSHERERLLDHLVDVERNHLRIGLFRELPNPADHFAGAMGILDNLPDVGERLFET